MVESVYLGESGLPGGITSLGDWSTPNVSWGVEKNQNKNHRSPIWKKNTITLSFQIQRLGFEKVVQNSWASLWDQNNIHQVRFYRTRQNKQWKRPFPWWNSSLYWLVHFRNLQSCLESPYIKNKPTKGNPTDPQLVDLILTLWSEYAQKFHPSLKKHYIFIPIPRHRNNSEGIWTQKFQYLKHPEVFECLGYVVTYTFQVCKTYLEWKQQKGSSPVNLGNPILRCFLWRFPRKFANSTKRTSRFGSVFQTNRYPKIMLGFLFE